MWLGRPQQPQETLQDLPRQEDNMGPQDPRDARDKGMVDGQNIVFSGEGYQEPGLEPGDITLVLAEKERDIFKRSSNDLIMQMRVEMVEALCGFQKVITTLDNRSLVINSRPGEVTKHGDVKCILNEGMPQYRNPFEKGRLTIQFMVMIPDNAEVCMLVELNPEQKRFYHNVYNEDEPGLCQSRVQCATQRAVPLCAVETKIKRLCRLRLQS
ncbi:hypothetical protein PR048_022876 [Dryococelus australis]|uniref:Chaperone DnaJ C-terminal domain-containing protein n=1 Tax=Dryococelus australis TaxID=614101 RepID=A0ABQ9GSK6_9NEOP|nr:hypothetical protein PR048_022876 [Dryococelus australis]